MKDGFKRGTNYCRRQRMADMGAVHLAEIAASLARSTTVITQEMPWLGAVTPRRNTTWIGPIFSQINTPAGKAASPAGMEIPKGAGANSLLLPLMRRCRGEHKLQ
ncbi:MULTISPECIES: hypothetical protein [Mycobacteriaceae]|uniref:hypothetical protein n=1 Tax=Mycobacteriaceae TaxID=1762 RepID=UPI000268246B|nr:MULTISPECIES: hypothetical protein [Mycobacteriaceae]EIU74699.1 hypothetical protein MA6G1108_5323 [Mycobacteroides abscessus 6G-1108]